MLVYVRESDKEKVFCDVDEKDIAEHLRVNHIFRYEKKNSVSLLSAMIICFL